MVAPWQLCRRCCCRYGIFPVLVVPIVTFGCLLSLYSSTGCKFVNMEIGFQPVNEDWYVTTPYSFGSLFYHNSTIRHDSMFRESLHSGCVRYSDEMYENFIAGDRTFKMIQVMSLISCGSSALAMVVAWLFVVSPIPAGFLWPGVLLPSIMVAFISEGSKFLLFDTGICRSAMWYRGSLLVPEQAESCTMGETAWFACAAGVLHFWALVCVCLRTPERRTFNMSLEPFPTGDVDKEENEDTSDDPDLAGGDDNHSLLVEAEKGQVDNIKLRSEPGQEIETNEVTASSLQSKEIADTQQSDTGKLSLAIMPIDTGFLGSNCCSPMSESKTTKSPEVIPEIPARGDDAPLSPVDCIIEGFDIATDLSQIDVCRTMAWSPAQKTLEDVEAEKDQGQAEILPGKEDMVPEARATFLRLSEGNAKVQSHPRQANQEESTSTEDTQQGNGENQNTTNP